MSIRFYAPLSSLLASASRDGHADRQPIVQSTLPGVQIWLTGRAEFSAPHLSSLASNLLSSPRNSSPVSMYPGAHRLLVY